jgi:hypothetical protein
METLVAGSRICGGDGSLSSVLEVDLAEGYGHRLRPAKQGSGSPYGAESGVPVAFEWIFTNLPCRG